MRGIGYVIYTKGKAFALPQIGGKMKSFFVKNVLTLFLFMSFVVPFAHADHHGGAGGGFSGPSATKEKGGGFSGPSPAIMSLSEANKQADETWLTLKGTIVRRLGHEMYVFKDASGEGEIEIDDDAWGGLHISEKDTVLLLAEVDKEWGSTKIEVKQVRLAK